MREVGGSVVKGGGGSLLPTPHPSTGRAVLEQTDSLQARKWETVFYEGKRNGRTRAAERSACGLLGRPPSRRPPFPRGAAEPRLLTTAWFFLFFHRYRCRFFSMHV